MKLLNSERFTFQTEGHKHLMDGKEVMGCSTIASAFDDKGWFGYWASGKALEPLGWINPKNNNELECILNAGEGLENVRMLSNRQYFNLLNKCYKAHAKETKDTAAKGTDLHEILENYIKAKIAKKPIDLVVSEQFKKPALEFLKWEKENQVEWLMSEFQVGSLMWEYCGIGDYLARIRGRMTLGDFKTSSVFKNTFIPQLVGLKGAIEEQGVKVEDLAVTRFSREGEFEHRVIEVDFELEFLAFLKARAFLEQRNLFKARWKNGH